LNPIQLYYVAVALAVGMLAQVIATRLGLPPLLLLLISGALVGPDALALLDPAALGAARGDLVTLAVTIILFEGGLGLRMQELRDQRRSLVLLLTFGGAISMAVGTVAAHGFLDMPWSIASLYGALVVVTGPTVVTPLLTRLRLDRTVREMLIGEAVLIDPLGAILAIVAADYVIGRAHMWEAGWLIIARLGVGGVIGVAGGLLTATALRRGWVPERLRNSLVLATVLFAATAASRISSEAGLMAAVAHGVVIGNSGLRDLGRLRLFKEEITVLLLSFLFVFLAADVPLDEVRDLGLPALLVVAVLMWIARPLAVFLCTMGSPLTLPQRLFIAWICPRGIVAASVAGLVAIWLKEAGVPGGSSLEALIFVTVAVTVTLQGLTAEPVARLLGVNAPTMRGLLIIGADQFPRLLARVLRAHGRQPILLDVNPRLCTVAHDEGLPAFCGDGLVIENLEEAGAAYADTVLAMTRNQELNALIGQRVRDNFRVERVLLVGPGTLAEGDETLFPGAFPGSDEVNRALRSGQGRLVWYRLTDAAMRGRSLAELAYGPSEFALVRVRADSTYIATSRETLEVDDQLVCLQLGERDSPLSRMLAVTRTVPAADKSLETAA
jgi:NhaP-type Na+/H+ or K+/H+ antiporter